MKKIMLVFGTRPEAIKMCPLVKELKQRKNLEVKVCVTGQHQHMLQQVLDVFDVVPDCNLSIMKPQQNLFDITIGVLEGIQQVLLKEAPNLVLVHGDTSTTFAAALASFYLQIPVGHVEAGLRTHNLYSPFPEEFNRQAAGIIAKYNFAPTQTAANNLLKEGKAKDNIFITGNTAIDALKTTIAPSYSHPLFNWVGDSRMLLLTAHRRENLGEPLRQIFMAVQRVMKKYSDVKVIFPIHANPKIREIANNIFGECEQIKMIDPLDVLDFHNFANKSYLVLTDSGGIQEEAPSLGKPVLVLRDTTERQEGVEAGTLKLVGTDPEEIFSNCCELLDNQVLYTKMSESKNPYGDGMASKRIADLIESF